MFYERKNIIFHKQNLNLTKNNTFNDFFVVEFFLTNFFLFSFLIL